MGTGQHGTQRANVPFIVEKIKFEREIVTLQCMLVTFQLFFLKVQWSAEKQSLSILNKI